MRSTLIILLLLASVAGDQEPLSAFQESTKIRRLRENKEQQGLLESLVVAGHQSMLSLENLHLFICAGRLGDHE